MYIGYIVAAILIAWLLVGMWGCAASEFVPKYLGIPLICITIAMAVLGIALCTTPTKTETVKHEIDSVECYPWSVRAGEYVAFDFKEDWVNGNKINRTDKFFASITHLSNLHDHVKETDGDTMYVVRTINYKQIGPFKAKTMESWNLFQTETDVIYLPSEYYVQVPGINLHE